MQAICASFKLFCPNANFLRFFFHPHFLKNFRWANAIWGFYFFLSLHYMLTLTYYTPLESTFQELSNGTICSAKKWNEIEMVMSYGCLNFWLCGEMQFFWDNEMFYSKNRKKSAFEAAAFSFCKLMYHECDHLLKS